LCRNIEITSCAVFDAGKLAEIGRGMACEKINKNNCGVLMTLC